MMNPFEFGRELTAVELVDRVDEVAEVIRTIKNGSKLFLIGPRRYGKTSILRAAADRLAKQNAVTIRLNAESFPSLDLFVSKLIAAAGASMKGPVERVGSELRGFFARLRPELSFSATHQSWNAKLSWDLRAAPAEQIGLLVDALDGLEALARAQPAARSIGLIIDEFQHIIALGGGTAEAQIRAAIQQHQRVGYVFAGSKTRMLIDMTTDATRPFYRLGSLRFLGQIPDEDFLRFLENKFTESGFAIGDDEALHHILDSAERVPYNVQMLASACWYVLRAGESRQKRLTKALVSETLERLVRQQDPFYTQLWSGLTSIQQKTLFAVIETGGLQLQSHTSTAIVGRGPSTVAKAIQSLIERDVIREEQSTGSVRVRFEDPFFAQWIVTFCLP